jgi:ribosomal protein S11
MSVNGPVTIGGWLSFGGEIFPGTISYVNVKNPVYTTTTYIQTSLLARYDASVASGYTLSGSDVTQWTDLTGNGYHLTANGTGPTITSINSVSALNFNSSRGLIRASVPLNTEVTVFIVGKYSTNIESYGSFMHHGSRDADWAIERNSTTSNLQFQSNSVNGAPQLSATNSVNYILVGRITGSTREFWRHSDTEVLGFATGSGVSITTGNKSIYVGKSETNEACNSTIGEILYYNTSLSNADVSSNVLYLQNKWLYTRYGSGITSAYVTLVANGTANITATQEAYGNYLSKSVSSLLTVGQAVVVAPSLGPFVVPTSKAYGDASFNITTRPSTNSGGAITYSSSNTSVATIDASGNWITLIGSGDVSFNALQAAVPGQYTSGTVTSNTLTVSLGTPTLSTATFSVASSKVYGDVSFAITTRPTSNSDGAITYSSNNTSVATIDASGNWITLVGAGDVSFNASQAAVPNKFTSASKASNTLTVALATSTFSASTFSIQSTKAYGDASFAITTRPSGNSGGTVTYSTSNTSVATIDPSGNWITLVGAGDVSFNASQAATNQYASATKASNTLTVSLGTPTLSSTTFSVSSTKTYGDASFAITTRPTSNSDGTITYSSSNTAVATIDLSGNRITLVGAGDVSFNASQAAVPNKFTSASKASNTLTVALATSTFSTSTFSIPSTKAYGDASFAITTRPSGNSGGAVTYSSSNTSVATIDPSGNWITLVGAGDVSFNASQAATNQYASATKASNTLTVSLGTPTLSSTTFSVSSAKAYGDASFAITTRPTSNSDGAITYSSSNTAVATIDPSGNRITLVGAGDVSFNASQAAVPNKFTSASKASNTLTVSLGTPTLSTSTFSVASSKAYSDASFAIATRPTSNSSGTITYTSSNTSVATIDPSGNWINIIAPGDVSFNATQEAVTNQFIGATKTSNTLTVSKATVALTFANPPATKNVTDTAFTVTASSASPGAVTYTSSNTSFATVNETTGLITLRAAGTVTITAAQESTEFYNAPTNATCSIVISPAGSALEGQTVPPSTTFSGIDLSGASFSGSTLSGVSFSGATLTNVNFSGAVITGTDFTNANISGATNLPDFSTVQKLQLLKNINNVEITEVQVSSVTGDILVSALSNQIAGIEELTFSVVVPTTLDASANKTLTLTSDIIASSNIYLPINTSDVIKINGVIYRSNGTNIIDENDEVVNFISIDGIPFRVYAGSFVGINTLSSLNSLKVNGSGIYDAMKSVYLLTSRSNAGAGSALSSNTIAALNATKINGDGLYDILNGLLQNL